MSSPIDKIRDGACVATIWKNQSEKGAFYSVDLSRTYKGSDGQLKDTNSFSNTELLRIARLAERAYDRVTELRAADKDSQDYERQDEG